MENKKDKVKIREIDKYQELELYVGDEKIGEAEVNLSDKMLSRLTIYPPYQDKGYGTEIVRRINEKYGTDCLWVKADNPRAMHVYEKNGYVMDGVAVYRMKRMHDDKI